jgi:hypothetical protein
LIYTDGHQPTSFSCLSENYQQTPNSAAAAESRSIQIGLAENMSTNSVDSTSQYIQNNTTEPTKNN